jgi:hypothetical protein
MSKNDERVYVYPDPGVCGYDDRTKLRDYFAGQALAGIMSTPGKHGTPHEFARMAFVMAAAMLDERENDALPHSDRFRQEVK